jgi:tRNA (guanine37-N1)-methyltransferase
MHVGVVTLFPPMFEAVSGFGITGRAAKAGILRLGLWNPRDYAGDRHRTVDDRPYGGGPGMVMRYEPLVAAIRAARVAVGAGAPVVHLSPQGRRFDQGAARSFAERPGFVLVAGRYEGIDERVVDAEVDEEWSIGDYVLSGGELAAMVVIDAVTRLLPEALGHEDSAREDSFGDGLLDYPHYTRPEVVEGRRVPEVLLSGDHGRVRRWRLREALGRTWRRRPDLLAGASLDEERRALLDEYLREWPGTAGAVRDEAGGRER